MLKADNVLSDLKALEILFQVIAAKYLTEYVLAITSRTRFRYLKHSGKIFPKIWVHIARLSSFFDNAVPFATGNCQKFRPKVLGEWKAPSIFFSALIGTTENFCSICLNNLQWRQPLGRTRENIT